MTSDQPAYSAQTRPERASIDVLIVTYRNRDTVMATLDSLPQLEPWADIQVGVHDNSADDVLLASIVERCAELGIPVRTESCIQNCGFGAACNSLALGSTSDWLLFLNPDARLLIWPSTWVPTTGVWGPRIIDERGRESRLYGRSRSLASELARILFSRQLEPHGHGYTTGACLLIDRSSFEQLDGFDESFYMFYEDIDLGIRASALGIPVRINLNWLVEHRGGHSSSDSKARVMRISAESSVYFHRKHHHAWRAFGFVMGSYMSCRALALRTIGRQSRAEAFRAASETYFSLIQ